MKIVYIQSFQAVPILLWQLRREYSNLYVLTTNEKVKNYLDQCDFKIDTKLIHISKDDILNKPFTTQKYIRRLLNELPPEQISEIHFSHTQLALFLFVLFKYIDANKFILHDFESKYSRVSFFSIKKKNIYPIFGILKLAFFYNIFFLRVCSIADFGVIGLSDKFLKRLKHINYHNVSFPQISYQFYSSISKDNSEHRNEIFFIGGGEISVSKKEIHILEKMYRIFSRFNVHYICHPIVAPPSSAHVLQNMISLHVPVEHHLINRRATVLTLYSASIKTLSFAENLYCISLINIFPLLKSKLLTEVSALKFQASSIHFIDSLEQLQAILHKSSMGAR